MPQRLSAENISRIIRTSYRNAETISPDEPMVPYITDREGRSSMSVQDLLRTVVRSVSPVVLLGEPGSGKTTLLNHLTLILSARKDLPFIARLRLMRNGDSLLDLIARSLIWDLRGVNEFLALHLSPSKLSDMIKEIVLSHHVVFLLDGVNELPRSSFDLGASRIQNAFEEYNWQKFILTNRTTNMDLIGRFTLSNSLILYHRGVSAETAKAFISNHKGFDYRAKRIMISEIDRGGKISSFLLNPQRLLLTCRFYLESRKLPSTLPDIFQEDLRCYASPRRTEFPIPIDFQFGILSFLAAEMTSRGALIGDLLGTDPKLSIRLPELLNQIPRDTALAKWLVKFDATALAEIYRGCLDCPFVIIDRGQVSFIHESYQDFFSALWLAEQVNNLSDSQLHQICNAPSWEDAVVFASCMLKNEVDLTKLIDTLLKSEDGTFLAARCTSELPSDAAKKAKPSVAERLANIGMSGDIPELRARAMELLYDLGEREKLQVLVLGCYTDADWLVREMAALYAGSVQVATEPEKLSRLFDDDNHWVRAAAVWAAGELNLVELKSKLEQSARTDASSVVRQWGNFALQRLGKTPAIKTDKPWYEVYMTSGIFPECRGAKATEFYLSGLSSRRELTKSTSVEALSEIQYYPAFKKMTALSSDPSPYVRAWLMRSIGEAGVFSCVDVLLHGLADADPWVRFWAAHSTGTLRAKPLLGRITSLMAQESDGNVLRAIVWCLSNIGTSESLSEIEKQVDTGRLFWSPEVCALVGRLRQKIPLEQPFSIKDLNLGIRVQEQSEEPDTPMSFIKAHEAEIKELAILFTQYQRPDGVIIRSSHVERWLKQFNSAERMRYALCLLQNVDFYTRRRMAEIFSTHLRSSFKREELNRTTVTILGNPSDSSALVNYVIRDVTVKFKTQSHDLRSILARPIKRQIILFVDDNIGSGKQSIQIFREWLNIGKRILDEHHVEPLRDKEIETLRKCGISIITCLATVQGCERVRKELKSLGLNIHGVSGFYLIDQKIGCFHPTSNVFPDHEEREKAKEMVEEIGRSLLEDKQWPQGKKEKNALGYGGEEKLVVFFYNVPTATLPILWKSGTFGGHTWFPLFPRREKI